jgi:hypothetical protein
VRHGASVRPGSGVSGGNSRLAGRGNG